MTRIAIVPALTDGKYGLWSVARSEGRIPFNWGALLARHGYEVIVVSEDKECSPNVSGATFQSPDRIGEVDWLLWGTTSTASSNYIGLGSVTAHRVVRLQWPTGSRIDTSGNIVAVPHYRLADQVATETGRSVDQIHVLPSPTLPLAWWEEAMDLPHSLLPTRTSILWAARDVFLGSAEPFGRTLLEAVTWAAVFRGLRPFVLSIEQHSAARAQFEALGGILTSGLHLGGVLNAMRRCVVCVTGPYIMGPTLIEAIFEGCAPLIWNTYEALFPELVDAARKHGVLLSSEADVRPIFERLVDDSGMRDAFIDSCKFAFAEHSPEKCMERWRTMEARIG